jgi:precorrin-6B methylase 2
MLAPFDRTPPPVARAMLRLACLRRGERLLDVGCGDGAILIEAARMGAVAVGVDINPSLVHAAWRMARDLGLEVHVVAGDYKAINMWCFDVITLYLTTSGNQAVLEHILGQPRLWGGLRIVTHDFVLPSLQPTRVAEFAYRKFDKRNLYLYVL